MKKARRSVGILTVSTAIVSIARRLLGEEGEAVVLEDARQHLVSG